MSSSGLRTSFLFIVVAFTMVPVDSRASYQKQESSVRSDEYYPKDLSEKSFFPMTGQVGTPTRSGLTPKDIEDILDYHNSKRAGELGSNMNRLTWNAQLAKLGQQWSDGCNFQHGQPPFNAAAVGYKQLGQNLYAGGDLSAGVTHGLKLWFDEKADYTYSTNGCRPGKMCGHYTQMVWAKTTEVGCGLTKCGMVAGIRNANYLVCNYGPAGNMMGEKPYKKGRACSACDSGKFYCTEGLCDTSCSGQGSGQKCKCEANCGSCGTTTNNCECRCQPGFTGVACDEVCRDKHHYCNGNPGYPSSWCDSAHQFVLDSCPKMCKLCQPGDGKCSLRHQKRGTHLQTDWAKRIAQAELLDLVRKIEGNSKNNGDESSEERVDSAEAMADKNSDASSGGREWRDEDGEESDSLDPEERIDDGWMNKRGEIERIL